MRVGVVGPVAPDYFAENVGDALERTGHLVTSLGAAHSRYRNRFATGVATLARQALPSLDARAQRAIADAALEAQCDAVINLTTACWRAAPGCASRGRSCRTSPSRRAAC